MEQISARPAGLPSARDIVQASAGVWTLRGRVHHVDQVRFVADAPIKVLLQLEGKAEMRQGRQRVSLTPHQFALVDGSQPFSLSMHESFVQVLVAIPRSAARALDGNLDRSSLSVFGDGSAESLTRDFILSLAEHAPALSSTALWRSLAAVTNLLAGIDPGKQVSHSNSLLRRAMALIDMELATFNTDAFASRLGVSRRYLDGLFSQTGRTLHQYVWERRLQLASDRLRRSDSSSITNIAHAVGFKDSAHFSRAFRKRFGTSPRQWRRWEGGAAP
jgi:AraC-like DNA-binding protein